MKANQLTPPPRVLASSKKACFLCKTFLQISVIYSIHKNISRKIISRLENAHFSTEVEIVGRFVFILENYAKASLKTPLTRQKRFLFPCPSKSTLCTLQSLDSQSSSVKVVTNNNHVGFDVGQDNASRLQKKPFKVDTESHTCRRNDCSPFRTPGVLNKKSLATGVSIVTALQADNATIIQAGRLTSTVEYSVGPSHHSGIKCEQDCHAEWLSPENAAVLRADTSARVIDVDLLQGEVTVPAASRSNMCLAVVMAVVRLNVGISCAHRCHETSITQTSQDCIE